MPRAGVLEEASGAPCSSPRPLQLRSLPHCALGLAPAPGASWRWQGLGSVPDFHSLQAKTPLVLVATDVPGVGLAPWVPALPAVVACGGVWLLSFAAARHSRCLLPSGVGMAQWAWAFAR